jgi:putative intracellular protease/amidase
MRKILIVVSEYGYWGEELVAPLEVFDAAGYQSVIMTPEGRRPHALPASLEAGFWDPPLDKVVTDKHYAAATQALEASERLACPLSLREWFPARPYFNSPGFGHALEAYHQARAERWAELNEYAALLLVGGSGAMVDMANNQRLHDLILGFHALDRLIAAECYAVACLAFARDFVERRCLIYGRHVTGHALEYDWLDDTGVLGIDVNLRTPFYPLEHILRDAVGSQGAYHGGVGQTHSTILDYPFLTGRSTQDGRLVGELVVQVLEQGLQRYGWR